MADRHPLVAKLLAYRESAKLAGTYGANILATVHPISGRIHADYLQIGAASGRMACSRPNLQNIPRVPDYRACFRAPDGRVLVKADFSQIELRIAAELAGDQRMLDAYREERTCTPSQRQPCSGKTIESVSREDRQLAKALNFGLLYGMGATTLQRYALTNYGVSLGNDEAARFRDRFFANYPGIRRWHRGQPDGAVDTRTLGGRLRRGVTRFTEKLNTPIQGTGADGLKAALALLWETRGRCPRAAPVLVVHDEIVLEVDEAEAERARAWLAECMTRGMSRFLTRVPVVVDATIERDWSGTPLGAAVDLEGS